MIRNRKSKNKAGKSKDDAPKPPPPKPLDDDLYETGDIAAPERDRDDEQRGL